MSIYFFKTDLWQMIPRDTESKNIRMFLLLCIIVSVDYEYNFSQNKTQKITSLRIFIFLYDILK